MPKPFRGMSKPQMTRLRPDIALIEYSDTGAEEAHISTNTYACEYRPNVTSRHKCFIPIPFVRQLSDNGYSPAPLVISHRHVMGLGDAIGNISTEFKIPVLLDPIDARHQQALDSGIQFRILSVIPFLANLALRHYYSPARQQAPSFCIRPSTEAFFILVIQRLVLMPIRQKPVWSV